MSNKIKIITVVTVIAVFCILGYTQIYRPVSIQPKKAECITWDATYESIKGFAEAYKSGEYNKNTTFIHAFDGKLPSDNPNDYMTVYCTLEVKNRSIFHMSNLEAIVLELGNHAGNVLYSTSSSDTVGGGVFRFSEKDITFILDVYIGNMDETAIKEMVKGIKAKVMYEGDFTGVKEETIEFSNCNNITIENTVTNEE